ncbi:putative quinol monooxygenase [Pseudarthrobacter sp. YAF2]|uniref:putative quinol monooxygenase n=1 Tax=Pseudarthrobacter sp. YAF2 TaxID=3233078 RepID=UPI003F95F92F
MVVPARSGRDNRPGVQPFHPRYEYFRGVEDPQKIVILESYRTAADFQAHRDSQHFQEIGVGTIIPLLHDRSVSTYDSPAG